MARFTADTTLKGKLIALTSLVFIISGMKLSMIPFVMILVVVPRVPHIDRGSRSKLKICDIITVPKNC